uniref:Uncharacterized protein n=1 Tax=Arundo donax TaxID=35708 RepID=A0A0A9F3Q8_ARUDO
MPEARRRAGCGGRRS